MCGSCCAGANLNDDESSILDMKREREEKLKQKQLTKELKKKFKEDHSYSDNYHVQPSKFKKALFWICGIESSLKQTLDDNPVVFSYVDTSIEQDKFWSVFCDVNAVIALAISGFGIAFFNNFD
jgi:hypothetical protein